MALSSILDWLNPGKRRAKQATATLTANAEKALAMKTKAQDEELAKRPHSQTANEGMKADGHEGAAQSQGQTDFKSANHPEGVHRVAVDRTMRPR